MADRGVIQKQKRKQRGSPAVAVFHPQDVAKLKAERETLPPAPFLLRPEDRAGVEITSPAVHQPDLFISHSAENAPLVQALLTIADRMSGPNLKEPHFLTIKQAKEITGLPAAFLQSHFLGAGCSIRTGAGWRIARAALERFASEAGRTGVDTSRTSQEQASSQNVEESQGQAAEPVGHGSTRPGLDAL
jgi:hypothetical protein